MAAPGDERPRCEHGHLLKSDGSHRAKNAVCPPKPHRGGSRGYLLPHRELALERELAKGEKTQDQLGEEFGMTRSGISMFAIRHRAAIEEIRENLADPFAGIWAARKENRVKAYVSEYEQLAAARNRGHHEWSKARQAALRAIAEELGQLPSRNQTITAVVTHIVEGVSVDDLK